MIDRVPDDVVDTLRRHGFIDDGSVPSSTPLTGGVSSDIWRIDLPSGPICIKRALSKLKVEQDWHAPVERNAYEVAWMQTVQRILPAATPNVLMHDPDTGMFAMPFLPPETHRLWKFELAEGRVRTEDASRVGQYLGRIHACTAMDPELPKRFQTDEIFHAIRLDPYLLATAQAHPDLAVRLRSLAETTAMHRVALVHGDVSPKNILIGPDGPVFLDAECAWFGDPAFDAAFCLNHLLLKCLMATNSRNELAQSFTAFCAAYETEIADMDDTRIMQRTAELLPGLFLARVDGKSPVEYINEESDKNLVRETARSLLTSPPQHPIEVSDRWQTQLG